MQAVFLAGGVLLFAATSVTAATGTADATVAAAEDMAEAIKSAGKHVEFVELAGKDHWLSRRATRLLMLEATIKFLEAHNPPN
jgi:dipeptidyl aminopeptidase/acylaminoacyl peptidase